MATVTVNDSNLYDIADSIRAKLGVQTTYKPSQMADAIDSISGGGITPTGTKSITANGTYDVTQYASAEVAVPSGGTPVINPLSVTTNGTYTAPTGVDGYSPITVNVQSDVPHEVPEGYTQLKYCESSGTQIVDTGVKPTVNTKIQIKYFYLQTGTYSGYVTPTGCQTPPISIYAISAFGQKGYCTFGDKVDFTNSFEPYTPTDVVPTYEICKTGATVIQPPYTNRVYSTQATAMSGSDTTTIAIFGRNNNGTYERKCPIRFFREKIWDGETLVRDYVPCMIDETEEVGLYDVVGGEFYHNIGTGVLVGGEY